MVWGNRCSDSRVGEAARVQPGDDGCDAKMASAVRSVCLQRPGCPAENIKKELCRIVAENLMFVHVHSKYDRIFMSEPADR